MSDHMWRWAWEGDADVIEPPDDAWTLDLAPENYDDAYRQEVITCERCGRTTTDPDRWDPEADTGRIFCDVCWPQRHNPVLPERREP